MALVAGAWKLSFEHIDGTGKISTASRRLQAADAASAAAAATAHMDLFKLVSDTKIISYVVGQQYTETAIGALPAVTVLNSVQAVISASIQDQPNKFATLQIPGPKLDIFVGISGRNANIVDVQDILVTNYLNDFTNGGDVFISDGELLDPIYNASGERVTKYRRLGK